MGGLLSGIGQASQYDALKRQASQQAWLTRLKGKVAAQRATDDAAEIIDQDIANRYLRGMQQRQARRQQTEDVSAARAKESTTNTTVEAGVTGSEQVRVAWDAQIANMATSSSVTTTNAMQRALETKRSGESTARWAQVEAMGYDAQANQYRQLAKNTRMGMWASGLVGGTLAVMGGIGGYNIGSGIGLEGGDLFLSTLSGAYTYGQMGWDMTAMMNPYTAPFVMNPKGSAETLYGMIGSYGMGTNR